MTEAEVGRRFPCDDIVSSPAHAMWRGIDVDVPAHVVWFWLRQLQLAPYSYDWIDNLGRPSPGTLSDLPEPQPGARFTCIGGRWPAGRVLTVTPGEQLTATILGATMSYVVVVDADRTRLLLKLVLPRPTWYSALLALGDWPMARRQLMNIKRLAEGTVELG